MSIPFTSVVQSPPTGRGTALVIDAAAYARRVILRDGAVPWTDLTQYTNYLGQIEGLLKPDVRLVDLGAFYADGLGRRPDLSEAMSARTRTGFALRTLLADDALAQNAAELLSVSAQTSRLPLVVQVPSPLTWLGLTHMQATGESAADLDTDDGENASMYYADWLRRFSTVPVSLLLLDGRPGAVPGLPAEDVTSYTPLHNASEHYRWPLGLRTADVTVCGHDLKGVTVPADYWTEDDVPVPEGDFALAEIPAEAEPETVLARLARWQ